MFAIFSNLRKALRPIAFVAGASVLAACDPIGLTNLGGNSGSGPNIDPSKPIQVALLIPQSDGGAAPIAKSLENAARLAIAEQQGTVTIDLRVYDTGGQAPTAAAAAQQAVDDGAKIILGPLRAGAVNAAGLAVADEGINLLGFSNNATIAGGNVFILGPTFNTAADRLLSYSRRQGKQRIVIVHGTDAAGQLGRVAIEQAAVNHGVQIVSSESYELSETSISNAASTAAAAVRSGAADSIIVTADPAAGDFPRLMTFLPEKGVTPGQVQYLSLIRFDTITGSYDYPGTAGAWFVVPDTDRQTAFSNRYRTAYGTAPHPLAGLAYDGVSAIATLAGEGRSDALSSGALTSSSFSGTGGVFRFRSNGTNQRALAVATVTNKQMVILDPAPSSLAGGF